MRINARLDEEMVPKVQYLSKTTGLNISSLIKKSIQLYYQQIRKQEIQPADVFLKSGFVGCVEGEESLSENYKEKL